MARLDRACRSRDGTEYMTSSPVPWLHRLCRLWSRRGGPSDLLLWRAAEKLQPLPREADVELSPGAVLRVGTDDYIDREIYRNRYERAERTLLLQLARPGDVCIDVGANIGAFTLPLALAVGKHGAVLAFEPDAGRARRLLDNIRLAGVENVSVEQVAVGAQPGTAVLHAGPPENTGAASLHRRPDTGTTARVDVIRLADRVPPHHLTRAIVKIDVEGYEAEVLQGMDLDHSFEGVLLLEVSPEFGSVGYVDELLQRLPNHRAAYVRPFRARPKLERVHPDVPPPSQRSLLLVPRDRMRGNDA